MSAATSLTLGEVANLLVGYAFKSDGFLNEDEDGIPILRGENVGQGSLKWAGKTKRWREDDLPELARYELQLNDVILAMDRPIVGDGLKYAWITETDIPCLLVQRVCRIRGCAEKALTSYLRYVIGSPAFTEHIHSITTGANIPHISGKDITGFSFPLPELAEQEKAVEALAPYDELMKNSEEQALLLENAARLIYTEWFIRLRFPGLKQGKAGARELPSGWRATTIGAVTSYLNRGVAPNYDEGSQQRVINQKCIRNQQLSMEQARNFANEVSNEKWLKKGDVLVNSTGTGTLGRVAQVREELDSVTVDTHVTIVRPRTGISPWFFGQQLLRMEALFESLGEGATNQTELKRDRIRDTSFLLPSPQIMAAFDEKVKPMIEQIEVLRKQIAQLRQARDLLLPRLISGQLPIRHK